MKPAVDRVPPLGEASRPPEAAAVDAVAEVHRLQSAIAALGEALKAQARSKVQPVADRVEACKIAQRIGTFTTI